MRGNEKVVENQDIYSEEFPEFCIMSKDTATKSLNRHIFKESSYFPQMLVVDEAITQVKDYQMVILPQHNIEICCKMYCNRAFTFCICHTYEKEFMEYYFLLDLLGLGDVLDEKDYEFTLIDLRKEISKIDMLYLEESQNLKTTINLLNYPPKPF